MHKFLLLSLLIFLLPGCGQNSAVSDELMETVEMEYAEADAEMNVQMSASSSAKLVSRSSSGALPPDAGNIEKKIIRNGNLTLRSENLAKSRTRLDSLAKIIGGYIASETYNDNERQLSYNVSYRIPAGVLDSFLVSVESGGDRLEHKSINARDITEQYYDVKIRLKNERKVEQRYLELLNRARSVKDILEIEEKLGRVRQEIESKEGRLRYLDNQVGYSTITVYLYQNKDIKYEPEEREGFGQRLAKSLHHGWLGFVNVILFFLKLWPLWLMAFLSWRLIIWLRRRAKN
jgi:hypothetical protein